MSLKIKKSKEEKQKEIAIQRFKQCGDVVFAQVQVLEKLKVAYNEKLQDLGHICYDDDLTKNLLDQAILDGYRYISACEKVEKILEDII